MLCQINLFLQRLQEPECVELLSSDEETPNPEPNINMEEITQALQEMKFPTLQRESVHVF